MNENVEAQLQENTLESIKNQTRVATSAQVSVGRGPSYMGSIEASPSESIKGAIFVANSDSDSVSVIDPRTNTVIENITVRENPSFIESYERNFQDETLHYIYVANTDNNTVSVINPKTSTVVKNIEVGQEPEFIKQVGRDVYVANSDNNTVSVINPNKNNTVIKDITVGENPIFIESYGLGRDEEGRSLYAIYVANSYDNTISVIDPNKNNTVIKNITVGENPSFIESFGDAIYVANSGGEEGINGSISVIDPNKNNTVIKNITTVGRNPGFIESFGDAIYVANSFDNTISVIDPNKNNTVIKNITVGAEPRFIESFEDAIYVANQISDTVSIINPLTKKVVAGVTFDINPLSGGQIFCNSLSAPISRFLYVPSGTGCSAEPNNGFEFTSWTQSLPDNTTVVVNASTPSGSSWTSFLEIFGIKSVDPAANLTVSRFGKFTAYFSPAPPPVPDGIWIALFSILLGTFMPSIIRWINGWRQRRRFYKYMEKELPSEFKEKDRQGIEDKIAGLYAKGKINDSQYKILKDKIAANYDHSRELS
jgi:YVTN family beta-propeller protein